MPTGREGHSTLPASKQPGFLLIASLPSLCLSAAMTSTEPTPAQLAAQQNFLQPGGSHRADPTAPSPYRRSSKNSVGNPFPREEQQRRPAEPPNLSLDNGREERKQKAPTPPAESQAGASNDAGGRGAARKPAFDRDGPVEAVALQSDWQFWNIFSDVRTIGKGHFAKVKQVEHNESHEHFASKILDKAMADNDIEDLVREFQMLRALRHANIIRLYAAYETPRKLYLVTELSTGGELMKRLGSDASVYSEDEVRRHVLTILSAVHYMHTKHCVHRDIKPENVLLSDNTDNAEVRAPCSPPPPVLSPHRRLLMSALCSNRWSRLRLYHARSKLSTWGCRASLRSAS